MAYTPINWQTGDTITAEKLNKMDNGWAVESSSQTFFSETVTTAIDPEYPDDPAFGELSYSTQLTADTVVVTFGGTDYTCHRMDGGPGTYAYGGWSDDSIDFSTIPFCIFSEDGYNSVVTETEGTYAISVAGTSQSIETSTSFEMAVKSFVDTSTVPMECVSGTTTLADMQLAYGSGRILFFRPYMSLARMKYITGFTDTSVDYIPEDTQIAVSITNGIFSVAPV